jgi:hypothetical protein
MSKIISTTVEITDPRERQYGDVLKKWFAVTWYEWRI